MAAEDRADIADSNALDLALEHRCKLLGVLGAVGVSDIDILTARVDGVLCKSVKQSSYRRTASARRPLPDFSMCSYPQEKAHLFGALFDTLF